MRKALTSLIEAKLIFYFVIPSSEGDMCWWPGFISDSGPGSPHKSPLFSAFPNFYADTTTKAFPDINPKSSHLYCAQDIWCLEIIIANEI